jgi:hypothetical protein
MLLGRLKANSLGKSRLFRSEGLKVGINFRHEIINAPENPLFIGK